MRVLVTGGAGHIGKTTTERLVRNGYEVRAIGAESGVTLAGAEFVTCDILNYTQLREQMRDCQAVIHLAAIRGPQLAAGHKVFEVNVSGTFNVFEAAAAEGIRRVVQASSINALGCMYSLGDFSPEYLPIDEKHPSFTTDPYSYSKEIVEDIGRYYWRREGISSVAMRFPGVYLEDHLHSEGFRQSRQAMCKLLDEFAETPEAERLERLGTVKQRVIDWRQQRPLEFNGRIPETKTPDNEEDPLFDVYAMGRSNLWALLDVRDAAQSLERALTSDYEGAHALYINDHHNWLSYESMRLAHLFFPDLGGSKVSLSGLSALVSIDKARSLIGFEPAYSVEQLERT